MNWFIFGGVIALALIKKGIFFKKSSLRILLKDFFIIHHPSDKWGHSCPMDTFLVCILG